jgi:excisionase family DNA binding protein
MIASTIQRELLRVGEVAAMLAICERGVWRLVARAELPQPLKVGRSARWRMQDVQAYIERLTQRAA